MTPSSEPTDHQPGYCLYRLNIVRRGTVVTFTGYTHDAEEHRPLPPPDRFPIRLYTERSRGTNPYCWASTRVSGQDHEHTIVFIPHRKLIINVIPA